MKLISRQISSHKTFLDFLLHRKLMAKIQMYIRQDTLPHELQFLTLSIKWNLKTVKGLIALTELRKL